MSAQVSSWHVGHRFQHVINGSTVPMFEKLDADGDDKLSKEEMVEVRKHLNDDTLHVVRSRPRLLSN